MVWANTLANKPRRAVPQIPYVETRHRPVLGLRGTNGGDDFAHVHALARSAPGLWPLDKAPVIRRHASTASPATKVSRPWVSCGRSARNGAGDQSAAREAPSTAYPGKAGARLGSRACYALWSEHAKLRS
jgi:hypothetical protein